MLVLRNDGKGRRCWNATHVIHVYDDFMASTFAKTSEMIFHDVSSCFVLLVAIPSIL